MLNNVSEFVWWRVSGVCVLENVCACVVEVCAVCYVCESSFPPSLMHVHEQNKNSEFCAPLTSFDWNETDPNILGASSIDTTCTIWGLEVGTYMYPHSQAFYISSF